MNAPAAQSLHPLAVGDATGLHVARYRGRSDETQRRDQRMIQQRIHRLLVTVNDIHHAVGQPGLRQQLGQQQRRRWVALGGFKHETVAARQRDRKHPHRHHRRKIKWRHARDYPERRAHAVAVHPPADVIAELAFQQLRRAAREFHHFDAAGHFPQRIIDRLAMFL